VPKPQTSPPAPDADARRGRGRPPTITRDDVIAAATRLGPAGLTVQAVAAELGVTRAAIYHYVADADELRRMAAVANLAPFGLADDHSRSWQDALRHFAHTGHDWRMAHGVADLVVHLDLVETQWFLVLVDRVIGVLVDAGFDNDRAVEAFQFLVGTMWINTQDELMARSDPHGQHPQDADYDAHPPQNLRDLTYLQTKAARSLFREPKARFERELEWVIRALEAELADTKSRARRRRAR